MQYLISALIAATISIGILFVPHVPDNQSLTPQMQKLISEYVVQSQQMPQFGTTQPIAGQTYTLAGSGISSTQTSITLSSFTIPQNGYKIQDADLSSTFYITLESGNPTKQEIVSCTTDVQNANNSATFSGCIRGLSPIQPYTASTTLKFSHGGGTSVIFSNPPQLFNEYAALQNTQSITGQWTFDDNDSFRPRIDADTDTALSTGFITLGQLSRQAISGAANGSETVKGIAEFATALEQASSTVTGSTGAGLVMQARYATDTPQSGCAVGYTATAGAGCSVIAQLTGKIRQTFLNLAEAFTVTGSWIFSSTATLNATTTIAASSVLNNALVLNTVPYQFPSSQGANGKTLVDNGSGVLAWSVPPHYSLTSNSAILNSVSTNGTSTVALGIPAGTLTASSTITAMANVQCLSNVTCTYVLRDSGGTTFASCTVTGVSANTSKGFLNFSVNAQSSLSSQSGVSNCFINDTTTGTSNTAAYGGSFTSATFNTANALSLVMGVQGASGSVTQVDNFSIVVIP